MIVGLTGNFGMGKSYVLSVFRRLGAVTIDSDKIVDVLLKEKEIIRKVKSLLGDEVLNNDGNLNKGKVANKIFDNNKLRNNLEVLLHPIVFSRIDAFLSKIRNKRCIVVVEVPLLFEGEYQRKFDRVLTVYTTKKTAIERLMHTGLSRAEALSRLKAQISINTKKKLADYTINNNYSKQQTYKKVEIIYRLMREDMEKKNR